MTAIGREEFILAPPLYIVFTHGLCDFEMLVTLCTGKKKAFTGTVLVQFVLQQRALLLRVSQNRP